GEGSWPCLGPVVVAWRGQGVAVVPQQQLLEGRWVRRQRADAERRERPDRVVDPVAVDLEADLTVDTMQVVHAGKGGEGVGALVQLGSDGGAGEVPQLGEASRLDDR